MVAKHQFLNAAEIIDSFRVVPRLFLGATFGWCVYLTDWLIGWYVHLPHAERSIEASGFASVTQLGVLGFLKLVYTEYARTSRDWNDRPAGPMPTEDTRKET